MMWWLSFRSFQHLQNCIDHTQHLLDTGQSNGCKTFTLLWCSVASSISINSPSISQAPELMRELLQDTTMVRQWYDDGVPSHIPDHTAILIWTGQSVLVTALRNKRQSTTRIPNFIRAYSLPWTNSAQGVIPCMPIFNPSQLLPSHCGISGSWLAAAGFGHHAFTHTHPKQPCNSACQLRTDGTVHESPGCWLKHIQYCRSSLGLPLLFRTNSRSEYRQPNEANSTANHGLTTISSGSMYQHLIRLLGRCYHCRQMT